MRTTTRCTFNTETVAEALLALLRARGFERVYLNGGSDFPAIGRAYARAGAAGLALPSPVVVSHENVAMGMAHGAYLATGEPQLVMVHTNVGTANALMGIMNARHDRVPIVLVAGRAPLLESGAEGSRDNIINWGQEMFDQAGMLREMVKWDYELRDGLQVEAVVDRARAVAMTEPRAPVYLTLPREVLAREARAFSASANALPAASGPHPASAAVDDLVDRLVGARLPVIVTNSAGADRGAFEALSRICADYAIGVVEFEPRFVSISASHPYHLGYRTDAIYDDADLLWVLECDVPWYPGASAPPERLAVIQSGVDPLFSRYPIRNHRSMLTITSTARSLLDAVEATLRERGHRPDPDRAQRLGAIAAARRSRRRSAIAERSAAGEGITKAFLNAAVKAARDEETVICNEYWAHADMQEPTLFETEFHHPPAGGLGWALPAAMGIQLERPDRTVVAAVGDGAYLFSNPAACHQVMSAYDLPVLTVIANNGHFGAVNGLIAEAGGRRLEEHNKSQGYERYAEASGGHGERVERPDDLIGALQRAFAVVRTERRHAVVNVVCSD